MNRATFRFLAAFLLASLATLPAAESKSARPNLLLIQTDEHNFRTLGCYRALLPKEQAFIWRDGGAGKLDYIELKL
jgi:uncharacterized sulfatase